MERIQLCLYEDTKFDDNGYMIIRKGPYVHSTPKGYMKIEKETINAYDILNNPLFTVSYHDLDCVNISMCSRFDGAGGYVGITMTINVDLDFIMIDDSIQVEIVNPNSFQKLIDALRNHNVECIDLAGVIKIYELYPFVNSRTKYLINNFNAIAKKYGLDHPRI